MDHLFALLMFGANVTTCVRLITYRRDGSRYRAMVSLAAWLLIAATGSTALGIVLGIYPPADIHAGDLGIALVLCALSLTARGNVAAILRTHHDEPTEHPARR